jgi:hypothetical protein
VLQHQLHLAVRQGAHFDVATDAVRNRRLAQSGVNVMITTFGILTNFLINGGSLSQNLYFYLFFRRKCQKISP